MSDHWIPINYDEDVAQRLDAALYSCYRVHTFTLKELNHYFIAHAENLLLGDFRRQLAEFLRRGKESLAAQHYTLTKAAEKTFPYFTENKKINGEGKFIAVEPIPVENYIDIQIETRQVWRKYLALNSLITTAYGTIYLDEKEWPEIVANQAAEKGIGFDTVPFLWHSILIRVVAGEPMLKFNLHEPDSKFGKRGTKEMKQYV